MVELSLQKGRADLGAFKAPDAAAHYQQEIISQRAQQLLEIAQSRQAILQRQQAQAKNPETASAITEPQPQKSEQKPAATEKQQVQNGTNTGPVTHARAKLHSASAVTNNSQAFSWARAVKQQKSQRSQHSVDKSYGLLGHRKPERKPIGLHTRHEAAREQARGFGFGLPA